MKSILVSVPILLLLGCGLFEENEGKKPAFIGEWQSTARFEYTLGDSLYRDSLYGYMLAHGFDLDSIFDFGSSYPYDRVTFDSLMGEFAWECPDGIACGDRLRLVTNRRRFAADSVYNLIYEDGVVRDSSANPYTYTEDSLFYHFTSSVRHGVRYEFKPGRDTLILGENPSLIFGLADTLIRLE